jgi:hypothetical protein
MSDLSRREIIHEHEYAEQLARILPDFEEADEFTAAAEDLLSYDPRTEPPRRLIAQSGHCRCARCAGGR